jgi:hypothetical protein
MAGLGAAAHAQQGWTVRPEWVRAHEEFLASDALAGRGSATRDERIAAEYVASEFVAYGLAPAPGMTGYIQSAEVFSPALDGKATLQAGMVKAEEGTGFTLVQSGGTSASGELVTKSGAELKSPGDLHGRAVLLAGLPKDLTSMQAARIAGRAGAALILVPWDESVQQAYSAFGGKTRVPIHLKEAAGQGGGTSLVALNASALAQVAELAQGTMASLAVHEIPQAELRKTYNAIGYLAGSDPGAGTILLTAHLDHLGVGKPVNGDAIYNGANDDAAGTTAVLELAHALAAGPKLRRSVLFACYGSEEAGELGSTYFGEHPPVPLAGLVANLEFEMIGNQDPKMPKGVLLLTGWERSNLGPALKAHGGLLGPDPYPEQHFFERSDNYALALKGVVAHTAAGWGTPPTYHQPSDDLAHLDLAFMASAIQSLVEPVRWLAMSDFKPEWNKDGQPKRGAR